MTDSITSRYKRIFEEIQILGAQRNIHRERVDLIVVTKKQNINACLEVIAAGASNIGENYAEEANEKFRNINTGTFNIHLIGHLQSRKIKMLSPLFSTIQTLDSIELAEKVNRYFAENNKILRALIEINLTAEIHKFGFSLKNSSEINDFLGHFEKMIKMPNIQVCGLMTMGYLPVTTETNRLIFRKAKEIHKMLKDKYNLEKFDELSMGTSGDYQTAIQEGATMVRIGEKIMGSRENVENK
jgi:PLP dependent protein